MRWENLVEEERNSIVHTALYNALSTYDSTKILEFNDPDRIDVFLYYAKFATKFRVQGDVEEKDIVSLDVSPYIGRYLFFKATSNPNGNFMVTKIVFMGDPNPETNAEPEKYVYVCRL